MKAKTGIGRREYGWISLAEAGRLAEPLLNERWLRVAAGLGLIEIRSMSKGRTTAQCVRTDRVFWLLEEYRQEDAALMTEEALSPTV